MAKREHIYEVTVAWTGDRGAGTADYRAYGREHAIRAGTKSESAGSADPAFRGDADRWNPEELMLAAASACHKLWYLHLAAEAGVVVSRYEDAAQGFVADAAAGGGFSRIVLRPKVTIRAGDDLGLAERLHHQAHAKCNIANSVNFPILCEPTFLRAP